MLLSARNISKTHGFRTLFEGVSLSIDEGDRLGWRLTKEGTAQAKALLESVLATA